MIERCEAKRRIDEMPWPQGTRPLFSFHPLPPTPNGPRWGVRVYHPATNKKEHGWICEATALETALRTALETWVEKKGLPAELLTSIARLSN